MHPSAYREVPLILRPLLGEPSGESLFLSFQTRELLPDLGVRFLAGVLFLPLRVYSARLLLSRTPHSSCAGVALSTANRGSYRGPETIGWKETILVRCVGAVEEKPTALPASRSILNLREVCVRACVFLCDLSCVGASKRKSLRASAARCFPFFFMCLA